MAVATSADDDLRLAARVKEAIEPGRFKEWHVLFVRYVNQTFRKKYPNHNPEASDALVDRSSLMQFLCYEAVKERKLDQPTLDIPTWELEERLSKVFDDDPRWFQNAADRLCRTLEARARNFNPGHRTTA